MIDTDENSSTFDNKFANEDRVCVKLRGLPFRVEDDQVYDFFAGFDYIDGSLIIGVKPDGKRTGEGVILFLTEEDAQKAIEGKSGNNIGERWIDLSLCDFRFYQGFYDMGMKTTENTITSLLKDGKKKDKSIVLRGIPFSAQKNDIVKFLAEFQVTEDNVHFEIRNGRFSGRAAVFMEDEDQALLASEEMNKKYIGNRYIEVEPGCKMSQMY